jgi:hypothetical protein
MFNISYTDRLYDSQLQISHTRTMLFPHGQVISCQSSYSFRMITESRQKTEKYHRYSGMKTSHCRSQLG